MVRAKIELGLIEPCPICTSPMSFDYKEKAYYCEKCKKFWTVKSIRIYLDRPTEEENQNLETESETDLEDEEEE